MGLGRDPTVYNRKMNSVNEFGKLSIHTHTHRHIHTHACACTHACIHITSVILELHFWDFVHCLLISFRFGSEILKKIGPPQPPPPKKNNKKKPKKTWIFTMGYL